MKKKTNYEVINNSSVDDLAEFLETIIGKCEGCPCNKYDFRECYDLSTDCSVMFRKWLLSEIE